MSLFNCKHSPIRALRVGLIQALGLTTMLHEFWNWWQFNFYLGLASLAAGTAVISPFLLSKSFRKRIARMDLDLEAVGLLILVLAVVIVGLYNWFGAASSGA